MVVVVAAAVAEGGEADAAFFLLGDVGFQRFRVADADVEVAVSGKQDAVDAIRAVVFFRGIVGHAQCLTAGGTAVGIEGFQRVHDFGFFTASGRR